MFRSAKSALRSLSAPEPAEASSEISGGGGGGGGGGAAGPPLVALTVNIQMFGFLIHVFKCIFVISLEIPVFFVQKNEDI